MGTVRQHTCTPWGTLYGPSIGSCLWNDSFCVECIMSTMASRCVARLPSLLIIRKLSGVESYIEDSFMY